MTLFTLAVLHARSKWLRTTLLATIFALGVASMTGLHHVSAQISDGFEKKLTGFGANILVTPKQESLTISYGGYTLGDVALAERPITLAASLAAIDAIPLRANVAIVAPKLIAVEELDGRSVAVVGVDWRQELALKGYWEVAGELPDPAGVDTLLAGAALADRLDVHPGQNVRFGGRDLRLGGVLRSTGSDDDNVLFAPLALIQNLTGKSDQVSFLEVAALCSGCPIDDIVDQLQSALPATTVRALRQVAESRMYAVHFAQNLAFSVSLVILITACAMLVMSMLSAVAERRKEIGIMRAVGFSRGSVFAVFLAEALGIGLAAGMAGYAAGHTLAVSVLQHLHLADTTRLAFDWGSFLAVMIAAGAAGGLAAALPAWKASLVEPAEALVAL